MFWIPIERSSTKPLTRQIYEHIRTQILCGILQGGAQLPSTRELAANLHLSRNVILEAYDQLLAEGYLESRAGSGTYVAEGIRFEKGQSEPDIPPALSPVPSRRDSSYSETVATA